MPNFATLDAFDFKENNVLLRLDLNLPVKNCQITDDSRIVRSLPTINTLLAAGAKILIVSHFGRPKGRDLDFSLQTIADLLKSYVSCPVQFVSDCVGPEVAQAVAASPFGSILVLENVRFYPQEESNDLDFAQQLAEHADVYVNDAFSCSHRAHASVVGVTHYLPAYAGLAMAKELVELEAVLGTPQRPLAAIIGGSKVSTKIELLTNLCQKVDTVIIGGGMANTFLAAQGVDVGASRVEGECFDTARQILATAQHHRCRVLLPVDGVVTKELCEHVPCRVSELNDIEADEMLVDIGEQTIRDIQHVIQESKTVIWNGPVGVFEVPPFDKGSKAIALALADAVRHGVRVTAGGGDTLAALAHAGCDQALSYTSTAGGAFLEWLEGKTLPGVAALINSAVNQGGD